jgi:hypothetical protein
MGSASAWAYLVVSDLQQKIDAVAKLESEVVPPADPRLEG